MAKYIDKVSKKKAKIYEGIQQRKPYNLQLEVSGIPQTSWDYDTDDEASWDWGSGIEDDSVAMDPEDVRDTVKDAFIENAARAYLDYDSLTQSDAAEMFSTDEITIHQSTISTRVSEIKEIREMRDRRSSQDRIPADD